MAYIDLKTNKFVNIDTFYSEFEGLCSYKNYVYFKAGSFTEPWTLLQMDVDTKEISIIKRSRKMNFDPEFISKPLTIEFPTTNNEKAYAYFYAPKNPRF